MTSFTPVYELPYPDALDAPCDFPEGWCAFTAAVDAVLDRFELGASRVLPAIPIAKVMITEQVTIDESTGLPWDTVSVDTPGWTNFDANNRVITVSRSGRYSVVAAILMAPEGSVNHIRSFDINGGLNYNDVDALDRNTADVGITSESEVQDVAAGTSFFATVGGSGATVPPDTVVIRSASMTVFWHADEERP